MPIRSAVANQLRERPTPSCSARTTRPRAQTMTLSFLIADSVIAGSILTPPVSFIQRTVACEFATRTRESTGSVRPLVTRMRSPW